VIEHPDVEGEIVGVHTDYVVGWSEGEPILEGYEQVLAVAERHPTSPCSWTPTGVTTRVSAQHSQFLFGLHQQLPYGTLALPTDELNGVLVMSITAALKPQVANFLRNALDITSLSMFPDLPGFGSAFSVAPTEDPYRW
jgi:hypothetical protein